MSKRGIAGLGISLAAMGALLMPAAAGAAEITVTSNLDNGTGCTLREAIASANTGSATGCANGDATGTDTIVFNAAQFPPGAPAETINLDFPGELAISSSLAIQGYGRDALTVDGAAGSRVFHKNSAGNATISGLKVTGGSVVGAGSQRGGGILNEGTGTLTLDQVCVCVNTVTSIESGVGVLARADGAGVASVTGAGNLTVTSSVIDGNIAQVNQSSATGGGIPVSAGGGIFQDGGSPAVTITDSTVSNNSARATKTNSADTAEAMGGGVAVGANLNVTRSTFSDNSADGASTGTVFVTGGAIQLFGTGSSSLQLSTVADNRTEASGVTVSEHGGGVTAGSSSGASLSVTGSTIARNGSTSTPPSDAGLNVSTSFGTITLKNSIVSNPMLDGVGGGKNCEEVGGSITSAGFNDDYTPTPANVGTCAFGMGTDTTADPLLDAVGLATNGGSTETIALQSGSPMIDKGSNAGQSPAGTDQRGLSRPSDFFAIPNTDNGTDIGAFEAQSPDQPPATAAVPTGQRAAALKKCKKKKRKLDWSKKRYKKCKRQANRLPL